ncbi:phage tail termination protein [Prescottella equi]|uniref:phage tail termination protein n=1 Tax=Rhodococcus hoagii TaxID=43767 RepID=UPI000D103995|nr:hypothetical protein [Prescottella equi]AVP71357.1 hypothetical protein C7H75_25070 [Prescottella equi]
MTEYPVRGRFPDFEQVLVDLLTPLAYTCGTLPDGDLEEHLPLIWARRVGGKSDGITDHAFVQLSVFSHKRAASQRLADDARELLEAAGGTRVNGVLIDWTDEMSGLLERADIDPLNRVIDVGYVVAARRQR